METFMDFTNQPDLMSALGLSAEILTVLMIIVVVDLILKGISMWKAAQNENKGWFIALFLFNTMGILPLIYLLTHKKAKEAQVAQPTTIPGSENLPKL